MKKHGFLTTFAAVAFLITSCANHVAGDAQPGMTPVDLTSLKTGALETEPTPFEISFSSAGNRARQVRFIEARRMLNYLVHPFDVDSDLTDVGFVKLMADAGSMTVDGGFPASYQPVAQNNHLVAGAYVSRTNGDLRKRRKLIISILRFATENDSRNAVSDFDRIAAENQPPRHPIPIAGHPDALATSANDIAALAFQQHGPYVIVVNPGIPEPNSQTLADIIKRTIDLQITQLDKQQPVPLDDLLDLPIDPDGIMRRAAPEAKDYSDPFMGFYHEDFGTFQASGMLHFERNPLEVRKAFEEGGVDLIGRRGSTVYRARDLASAFRLQTALTQPGKNDTILDPPPGISDAQCLQLDMKDLNRNYTALCAVVYGRYVAVVISLFPDIARVDHRLYERTAAQYSILAKSE